MRASDQQGSGHQRSKSIATVVMAVSIPVALIGLLVAISIVAMFTDVIRTMRIRQKDIPGVYQLECAQRGDDCFNHYKSIKLIIRPDGTLDQVSIPKQGQTDRRYGNWEFDRSFDGFGRITLSGVMMNVFMKEGEIEWRENAWLSVSNRWGKQTISVDSNCGYRYVKISDE